MQPKIKWLILKGKPYDLQTKLNKLESRFVLSIKAINEYNEELALVLTSYPKVESNHKTNIIKLFK